MQKVLKNPKQFSTKAWAKINLGLDVVGKLPNGYHLLETVYENLDLGDEIWISPAEETFLKVNNTDLPVGSDVPLDKNNIAFKAWDLLAKEFNLTGGLKIEIKKHIPVAGGLGGGSADAAAIFWAVNRLYDLQLSGTEMQLMAAKLGADVPYLIQGGTVFAQGIGDELTLLPRGPEYSVFMVNMGFPVETAKVYQNLRWEEAKANGFGPDMQGIIAGIKAGDANKILASVGNVLEYSAFELYPSLVDLRDELKDWGFVPMLAGSGGTMLGLTTDYRISAKAMMKFSEKYPFVRMTNVVQKWDFQPDEGVKC